MIKSNYFKIIFVSVIFPVIFIAAASVQPVNRSDEHKARAQEAAQSFMGELQGILLNELREGGPVQALSVCADTAQLLTQAAAGELGVSLKRVSGRIRNPENAPDEYERKILEKFSKMHNEGKEPPFIHTEERTFNGEKEFWYIQSIHLQAQCVGCHGSEDQIAGNVRKLLRDHYPGDEATGYKPGDFRGALRVSFSITNNCFLINE